MIRAVLFDLDDTLVDHTSAADEAVVAWAAELRLPGSPDQHRERWTEISSRHYARYQAREVTFAVQRRARVREFLAAEFSDAEADAAFADYVARYEAGWRLFPDARRALERIAADGLAVAVLTNGDRDHQTYKLTRVGLNDLNLRLFTSWDFPRGKPDPRAFLGTCASLGVDPSDTLMVGNSLAQDVHGALGAGLQAVLVDRHGTHVDHSGARITTLDDLCVD